MGRSAVLLLLPAMLLSQAAVLRHCPAGGDHEPHLHTSDLLGLSDESACSHSHCGKHHQHHDAPRPVDPLDVDPLTDHDADAVYIAAVDAFAARAQASINFGPDVVVSFTTPECRVGAAGCPAALPWVLPGPRSPDCPIYLHQRTLLI